jgi:putative transposase
MDAIDRLFTKYPFYGVPRIQVALRREADIMIGRDHARRLMRLMGLEAIYPKKKKNTSIPDDSHQKYPYLLSGITADHPNHIWGSDITYIPLEHGWCYLYAIIDWYSRLVVGWELSATMETEFCIRALRNAIENYGSPEISNTDQGSQFTDKDFISVLKENNIRISMDGRGRCMDNIFTERLWRTVKYEEVYLKSYTDVADARTNLAVYFPFYDQERPHQSLGYQTPAEVYLETKNQKSLAKIQILTHPNPSDLSTIGV